MINYIVTGTGRVGTVYMARLLTSLGFMCGHESIFEYDGIENSLAKLRGEISLATSNCSSNDLLNDLSIENWFEPDEIIAESSYLAAPYLDMRILQDVGVIHIVRNPLHVISSFVLDIRFFEDDGMKKWRRFVYDHCPEVACELTPIERACRYFVDWNKMIEDKSKGKYIRLKVENEPSKKLFDFLDITLTNTCFSNKKANSWKRRKQNLSLRDIPDSQVKLDFIKMCFDYGYEIKLP